MDTQEITLAQNASKQVMTEIVKPASSKESHPNGWQFVRLREVCNNTILVNPAVYPEELFNYIDVSSVSNELYRITETKRILGKDAPSRARKSVQTGDVIFATVRPTLKRVAIVPSELNGQVCSTGFCVLRTNRKCLEPQYLYFLLLTEFVNHRVGTLQKGATYPAINDNDLFNLLIPLPPISEQQGIANFLQKVQQAIQVRCDELKLERERKAALIEYLFIHGAHEEQFKQTELGEIPKSWQVKQIGEVATLQRGFDLPESKRVSGHYPVIGSNGITGYHSEYKTLGPGVFLGRSGSGSGKANWIESNYWPHNAVLWVSDFHGNYPKFIYYCFLHMALDKYAAGASIPTLNRNAIHPLFVALPPVEEQKEIATALTACDNLISCLEAELTILEELFHVLLEELMTGRLSTLPLIEEEETHE